MLYKNQQILPTMKPPWHFPGKDQMQQEVILTKAENDYAHYIYVECRNPHQAPHMERPSDILFARSFSD